MGVKIQKNPQNNHHFVTVPEEVRKGLGWEKGDKLEVKIKSSNTIELSKKQ